MPRRFFLLLALLPAFVGGCKKAQELSALVGPTLAEEGCINYDLHRSLDHKGHFRFYENWTSKELLDRHLQSAHVQRFIAKADQLLAEPPEITLWEILP